MIDWIWSTALYASALIALAGLLGVIRPLESMSRREHNGRSRLTTETRIFATDDVALGRFTAYWRIIFPGSAILRMTWLRAIKARAEQAAA